MDKETKLIRRKNWLQIINECNSRTSGTKKEWCEANGIEIRRLYYWQRHLRQQMAAQPTASCSGSDASPSAETDEFHAVSFADISSLSMRKPQSPDPASAEAASTVSEIMIRLRDCQVIAGSSFSEETLIRVIRSIRNA